MDANQNDEVRYLKEIITDMGDIVEGKRGVRNALSVGEWVAVEVQEVVSAKRRRFGDVMISEVGFADAWEAGDDSCLLRHCC